MKRIRLTVLILLAAMNAAHAYEFRTWKDKDGTEFKGRFYRELFGKLTLETEDGDKKVLAVADLSDLDKKYVRVMIPPEIEVEVRTKAIKLPDRPQLWPRPQKDENYIVTATIDKKSQRPFTSRLQAELFLVAEDIGHKDHVLLSYTRGDFLLLEEKDFQYQFKSKPTKVSSYEAILTKKMRGDRYKGHLLIISSLQGDVIYKESDLLPSWMEDPAVIDNLRELYERGAASLRSRHFGKDGKKVPPSRPPYVQPWSM